MVARTTSIRKKRVGFSVMFFDTKGYTAKNHLRGLDARGTMIFLRAARRYMCTMARMFLLRS